MQVIYDEVTARVAAQAEWTTWHVAGFFVTGMAIGYSLGLFDAARKK